MTETDQLHLFQDLLRLTAEINAGTSFAQVCDKLYNGFRAHVPYDRIGVALLVAENTIVRAYWIRSEVDPVLLGPQYQAPLSGSSLETIIQTGKPRIINDLERYLHEHPQSVSTRLIVREGMRSNLTFPLIADGKPIGFLFFTSRHPDTYAHAHVETFGHIATHLSLILDRTLAFARLVELNDVKNRFLGIAAHDLRSPLALVQSYLEMIERDNLDKDPEQLRHIFGRITAITTRMRNLVNDLLDLSAIESGQLQVTIEDVSPGELFHSLLESYELLAKGRQIKVFATMPPDLPVLKIDSRRISQVLDNLMSNALKFSPEHSEIHVEIKHIGDRIEVSVTDQGPGIPETGQKRLFQEFGRTSVKPQGGEKSTGLGLAIVKKIVRHHGGDVGVISRPGQGSTFSFWLPVPPIQP